MKVGNRLLALDLMTPTGVAPLSFALMNVAMLAVLVAVARERTEAEFRALFAEAGFALRVVVPTAAGASLLECVPT
jgi:hypothetical protein